jgi:hypothetical protein
MRYLTTAFPGAPVGPDRRPITDMLMVSIDFSELTFT